MMSALSFFQLLGIVLGSMVAGAGILTALVGGIGKIFGDDSSTGCLGLGMTLLLVSGAIAIWVVVAS